METSLKEALLNSISPDKELRTKAEITIKEAQKLPTYVTSLLKISAEAHAEAPHIAQSAAIQLKLMTERHWRYKDPEQAKKISIDGF